MANLTGIVNLAVVPPPLLPTLLYHGTDPVARTPRWVDVNAGISGGVPPYTVSVVVIDSAGSYKSWINTIPAPAPMPDRWLMYALQDRIYLSAHGKDYNNLATQLNRPRAGVSLAQARAAFPGMKASAATPASRVQTAHTNFWNAYSPDCGQNFDSPSPTCGEDYWYMYDYAWENVAPSLYYWNEGDLTGSSLLVDTELEIDGSGNLIGFADAEIVNIPAGVAVTGSLTLAASVINGRGGPPVPVSYAAPGTIAATYSSALITGNVITLGPYGFGARDAADDDDRGPGKRGSHRL